jgi:hypothetical protein
LAGDLHRRIGNLHQIDILAGVDRHCVAKCLEVPVITARHVPGALPQSGLVQPEPAICVSGEGDRGDTTQK